MEKARILNVEDEAIIAIESSFAKKRDRTKTKNFVNKGISDNAYL